MVKASKGFEFLPHKPEAATYAEQKWAWTGLQPGEHRPSLSPTMACSGASEPSARARQALCGAAAKPGRAHIPRQTSCHAPRCSLQPAPPDLAPSAPPP